MAVLDRRGHRALALVCLLAGALPPLASAQDAPTVEGETFTVLGVTETVEDIMARDALLPLGALLIHEKPEPVEREEKGINPDAPDVPRWPFEEQPEDGIPPLLRPIDPFLPQTVGVDFHAIQVSESGFIPPDSMGAAGPTQIVAVANGRIKVFSKTGVLGPLNTTTDNFFASVRVGGTSDPHVRYDRLSQRWFVVIIDVGACGNQVLMAVSSGPTITGAASFTFFAFVGEPNGGNPHFADYPTLGVDANALYIGANMFDTPAVGCAAPADPVNTTAWVVNKASIMGGGPATVTAFRGLVNYTTSLGGWTLQGADNDNPAATQGMFAGVDFFIFSRLVFYRVNNPGGVPTLTGPLNLTVPTTTFPQAQPQPAPGPTLDALDDRLFAAAIHRNKVSGTESLWTAHNIEVDTGCVGNTAGNRNGSRWYEIGNLAGAPSIVQSGTLCDISPLPVGYWIPSVAASGQGHMAMGMNRAGTGAGFVSIAAAGRLRTDALGSLQTPTTVLAGAFLYDQAGGPPERWGDYSQTVVDPNDDQTMWTFQEYVNATNSWGVRVTQLRAPLPATPASAAPNSVAQGLASVSVVVTGTSALGSEFFDPGPDTGGPGFANRIAAAVSGGVTVNSVTFNSPTQVTLNISTVGTPLGLKNITVTNPDGQSLTGNNLLTVTGCAPITVNPATIPAGTVGTAYSQTFTQTGGTGAITWSVTGALPTGVTLNPTTGVLSGTPTQTGSFPITITATDASACTGARAYTLVINCQTITVNPATIPTGTVGTAYSQTFTQTGGIGTITWSVTGTLPTGITLNPTTGVLSGTPTQTGSFPITITATDANGCTGARAYTLLINCQTITVNPTTIPAGTAGSAYSQTFTQTGGIGTITWSVAGTLPTGVTLNPSTGVLSGTPTQTGSFPITITATDANGCTGARAYTLLINCQTITVNPATIPPGTLGAPYSQAITQTGGIGTITWLVTGGLPAGVTLNPTTGVLSGTPIQVGSFPITIRATDANGCFGLRTYVLVINCQTITVNPATIPAGTAGTAYSQAITQTGGTGTITWSLTGTLPTGMTLNPTTGVLSGTPTLTGSFPITITATDANGCTGARAYTLVINCQSITVNPATIPAGTAGTAYSQAITQTGGIGTITWSLTGTLPTGMTLNPTTGVLSGTPTQTGSFPITVTATDANGCTGARAYTLLINCPTITVNPATIPSRPAGSFFSQAFTQTGGVGTVTWSVTGTLPPGVTLNTATGALFGTPTQTGSFPIIVTATDANGCTGARAYTLVITCQTIIVDPSSIPAGTAGTAYSQTFTQTFAVGPVTWSVTGTLPTGITLNPGTGVLSGTPTQTGTFPINVTATDTNGCTGTRSVTLVINCQSITVNPAAIPAGTAGAPYSQAITQTGGIGTITWSVTGALPTGITLNPSTGVLSGTPTQTGNFPIIVRATDANGCFGTRGYTLVVNCQTITVNPATLPAGTAGAPYSQAITQTGGIGTITWSVAGALPTGITLNPSTGVLSGTPTQTGSFPITVRATDANGCFGTRAYTLTINSAGTFVPTALAVDVPGNRVFEPGETVEVAPSWRNDTGAPATVTGTLANYTGPAGATYTITDGTAAYGSVAAGSTASCTATGNCYGVSVSQPPTRPVQHWDATAVETLSSTDAKTWLLHIGSTFADVPPASGFYRFVETIIHKGVTGGCSPTAYCPLNPTTREQMAVFVLLSREAPGYLPPPCGTTPMFPDVPVSSGFCRWIEELARRGVVGGCGGGNYCPGGSATREAMAVFVLRTLDPLLNPPACGPVPMFADVPASSGFCRWIEELARRGVVTGCGGGNYCPAASVTREQMAVFLTVTFGLVIYAP